MKKGDKVTHRESGSAGKIISVGEMSEMAYEVKWTEGKKSGYSGIYFARELEAQSEPLPMFERMTK